MLVSTGVKDGWPSNELILRWREQNELGHWVRKEKIETDFHPYLYINPKYAKARVDNKKIDSAILVDRIESEYYGASVETDTDAVAANGDVLWRVSFKSPNMVKKFTREISGSYEGDVPYGDRYLIDNVSALPEYEPRKVFIDLEALQYHRTSDGPENIRKRGAIWADWQMINVIGCYDSYTKTYVLWTQHPKCSEHLPSLTVVNSKKMMKYDGIDVEIRDFANEFTMLSDFVAWLDNIDPDMLLAWGMGFYDLPTLYARLESLGIGADKLSPSSLGKHRHVEPPSKWTKDRYNWTRQPINGRIVISLDKLFERVYRDSKSTNLPSNKLDIVGQKLFGRGKTKFRPDFYAQDYHLFLENYLYYNFRDVQLMIEIEDKYNIVSGQMALQRLAKCQFESTFYGSHYARVYFMRKAAFKQKTGHYNAGKSDEVLRGAIVLDPEELDTVGLHKNVAILDFSGLYPSCMIAANCSFETKVAKGEEREDDIIGDGCRFRRKPVGILPASVIELDKLRDEYKALRDEAGAKHGKTSNAFRKWDDAQKTVKRLRATFYGLMAFKGFSWSDMDIARTITKFGRDALTTIIKASEELGYKVIYGHTDSIFVKMGNDLSAEECVEQANFLAGYLTDLMQKKLQSDAMVVETEMFMDRFYLPRRNRYGGRVVWMPEVGFEIAKEAVDDRMKIQGLEARHANTSPVGRGIQLSALKDIWDDKSASTVTQNLLKYIDNIRQGNVSEDDLLSRARLGKWLPNREAMRAIGMTKDTEEKQQMYLKNTSWHYAEGATNENVSINSDGDNSCYTNLDGNARGAAWHNIVLSNVEYPPLDKGDSFYTTFVNAGPTWIPSGGYVSFHDPEQIAEYTIDIEKIIEKHVVGKLDHIMYGIGMSLDDLRPMEHKFMVADFFE
jgi:DNA polymerase elongation subunit (family B)